MVQMWLLQTSINGLTALIDAPYETVTKLLLDYVADVAAADITGVTSVMVAVRRGYVALTKVLVESGAT